MKTIILLGLTLALSACSDKFKHSGRMYHVKGASHVQLGTTGYVNRHRVNSIEESNRNPSYLDSLPVRVIAVQHNLSSKSYAGKIAVTPGAAVPEIASAEAAASLKKTLEGTFQLITPLGGKGTLISELNKPENSNLRRELRAMGGEERVVTTIAKVINYKTTIDTTLDLSGKGSYQGASGDITFKAASGETITLSAGSTFAYEYKRIAWNADPRNPKVIGLYPDQPGPDSSHPAPVE